MVQCVMEKLGSGHLAPADDRAVDYLKKIKTGDAVTCEIKRPRNVKFFRKWWALVGIAYDWWEPVEVETKWDSVVPEKNFERFRKDIIILAGHYECFYRVRTGDYQVEAKSIAFGNMSEDEFEELYSATIQVVLNHIARQGYTEAELRLLVDQTLEFA